MRRGDASPGRAYEADEGSGIGERMLARDVVPILESRRKVVEEGHGVANRFGDLSQVLLDTAASAGRIAKPFAAGSELQNIDRIVRRPQTDTGPPYAMPDGLRVTGEQWILIGGTFSQW